MSALDRAPREWVLRGPVSARIPVRAVIVALVLMALCLSMLAVALMVGDRFIPLHDVIEALRGQSKRIIHLYVVTWRLPRATSAIVVGALLGASGAIFQTITRNPLGSPDIIGFTTGAHTGGLIAILLIGTSYITVTAGAVIGGLATAVVILLFARRGNTQGFRLIIVGIAITSMLASIDTWLILTADLDLSVIAATWGAGSLNGVAWEFASPALLLGVLALILAIPLGRPLAQLDLGDDAAQALGARPEATRLLAIGVGVLQVAIATSLAGPIAFIALAAPQIGRRLARSQGTPMLPAALTGACLLLGADLVAQHVLPVSLPVGVVTVSIGGLYLLYLIVLENRKGSL